MGDAYGHIICVAKFSGNKNTVLKALNLFNWNSDYEPFRCQGDHLYIDGLVQYPSIYPCKKVVHDDNDDEVDNQHPAYNGDLPDDWYVDNGADTDLEDLIKTIGPLLETGEITISMNSTYKSASMSSGMLTIRSDLTGTRRYTSSSSDGYSQDETESYP
jgi:hypothetical protein